MTSQELSPQQCVELLGHGGVGRLAICTERGPQIFPLNFVVAGDAIVVRTSPYTGLGTAITHHPKAAFEADELDYEQQRGWSVVAHGVIEPVEDPEEVLAMVPSAQLQPWAGGTRSLFAMIRWQILSGRRVGSP